MDQREFHSTVNAIVLLTVLGACQHQPPRSLAETLEHERASQYRSCVMNLTEKYGGNNPFVDRAQLHHACADFARSRVPR